MTTPKIHPFEPPTLDRPARYRIEIHGQLDESWSANFGGMAISTQKVPGDGTITTLVGTVTDQSTLHGILNSIRDLGLSLLKVEYLSAEEIKGL
jgi:hypothetical protein